MDRPILNPPAIARALRTPAAASSDFDLNPGFRPPSGRRLRPAWPVPHRPSRSRATAENRRDVCVAKGRFGILLRRQAPSWSFTRWVSSLRVKDQLGA